MKREFFLYGLLGILTAALVLIQFRLPVSIMKTKEANLQSYRDLSQLLIEVESTIYLVEGDAEQIMVEGPENMLKKINTQIEGGCISIRNSSSTLISGMLNTLFNEENKISIYITLPSLENYVIGENNDPGYIKYQSSDRIGMSLKRGDKVIIESKNTKGCT